MALLGAVTGFANGIFGSGGGAAAVPMLKKAGYEEKKAHACSLALTLPLSVVSVCMYSAENMFDYKSALPLIPFGLVGAITGAVLMKKISPKLLSVVFGIIMIAAGGRNLLI